MNFFAVRSYVDDRVTLGYLHRGRIGIAVDREHLAAKPDRLDRDLTPQFARAEQHEAYARSLSGGPG